MTQNLCGVFAGAFLGWAASRLPIKRLGLVALVGGGVGTIVFGQVPADLGVLTLTAALAGACLHASMVAIHSLIARTYPPHLRAMGAGFSLGMARVGSAVGPAAAGFFFAAGMDRSGVTAIMGLGCLVAAGLLLFFHVSNVSHA